MNGEQVLGVDACKAGWVGVALADDRTRAHVAGTIEELVRLAEVDGRVAVVAVDIPIGLPDTGRRQADVLARQAAGTLWASVFMTPVRTALEAGDHPLASARNRAATGEGVSVQAFGLRSKVFDVDQWIPRASCQVVEVHPEVSFARLAGGSLGLRKTTWAGTQARRALLAGAGIALADDLGPAGRRAAVDDVLDAAVAAWTARRVLHGDAQSLPDPPQVFSDGLPCAIWV